MELRVITNVFILLMMFLLTGTVCAQDPVKLNPDAYKVALENEYVRVLDITLKPGVEHPMHSHPNAYIYFLSDGHLTMKHPEHGKRSVNVHKGRNFWSGPETHSLDSNNAEQVRIVVFEIKKQVNKGNSVELAPHDVAPDTNSLIYENAFIRVTETITPPGGGGTLHEHISMAVYSVTACKIEITDEDGNSRIVELKPGMAIWSPPVKHRVKNIGETTTHLLHVEVK